MEAVVGAIEALAEAKLNVRQRDIAYREYGATGDPAHREKWRDEAASRHWKLPSAGARLALYTIDQSGFDTARRAIDRYSRLSYEGADRHAVHEAGKAADEAIQDFTNQVAAEHRSVADTG